MQLELDPDLEARIQADARDRGMTVSEYVARQLRTQVSSTDVALASDRQAIIQGHIEWMKRTSPDWQTADPYAEDWQQIKAEGRKY